MLYASSKGPIEIGTMPLRYATNALAKLRQNDPSRAAEIEALAAHVEAGGYVADAAKALVSDERAAIGHNGAPGATPLEAARELLSDIETEASAWFDGADIENDAQADEVSRIIDAARKATSKFEADRKLEKQPHLDAGRAVDEAWKPLTASLDQITKVAKGVLTPWLLTKEAAKRAAETEARRVADEAAAEARRLAAEADGSLAAARERDAAIEQARTALIAAAAAERDKAGAKGAGMTRTVSLRTTWRAEVQDRRALLNHIAKTRPEDLSAWLDGWAATEVRNGARNLPGVHAWAEQVAA